MNMNTRRLLIAIGVGVVGVAFGVGIAVAKDKAASDSVRMREAAAKFAGVETSKIVVNPDASQDRGSCRSYYGLNSLVVDQFPSRFVVLPDHRIVGIDLVGEDGMAAILHQCGTGASAQWWAQRITQNGEQIIDNPEPKLTTTAAGTELNYFMEVRNEDLGWGLIKSNLPEGTYRVQAVLTQAGKLTMKRTVASGE
jgi:hypothetical protein